ncbi:hypothetical protein GUY60_34130, partial [Streptomyces sp. YC537]|nr:hypothetical protein [Streptomyces boluensis]
RVLVPENPADATDAADETGGPGRGHVTAGWLLAEGGRARARFLALAG